MNQILEETPEAIQRFISKYPQLWEQVRLQIEDNLPPNVFADEVSRKIYYRYPQILAAITSDIYQQDDYPPKNTELVAGYTQSFPQYSQTTIPQKWPEADMEREALRRFINRYSSFYEDHLRQIDLRYGYEENDPEVYSTLFQEYPQLMDELVEEVRRER
jgi:hypothetical protein